MLITNCFIAPWICFCVFPFKFYSAFIVTNIEYVRAICLWWGPVTTLSLRSIFHGKLWPVIVLVCVYSLYCRVFDLLIIPVVQNLCSILVWKVGPLWLSTRVWILIPFTISLKRILISCKFFFLLWRCDPMRVMASSFLRFLDHTQRHTTVGRTPLDEWSARRRDLYLTTHNTHNRQTFMPRWDSNPRSQQANFL